MNTSSLIFHYKRNGEKKQGFTFALKFSNIVKNRVTAKCNAVITFMRCANSRICLLFFSNKLEYRGITMKFIYTRSNDEIRIDQIEDPEAVIYVPERF